LAELHGSDPQLFQCVRTFDDAGNVVRKGLYFSNDKQVGNYIDDLPDYRPIVSLPEVHIRVDPPSATGSSGSATISKGTFFVSGLEAFVAATVGYRFWTVINLSTGQDARRERPTSWVSFSRWLLVVEENGEEIPIASFGEAK
jgi:hypothetical protein